MRSLWTPPEPGNRFVSCERACVRASVRASRARSESVCEAWFTGNCGGVCALPFSLFASGAFPFSLPGFCPFPLPELASNAFEVCFK